MPPVPLVETRGLARVHDVGGQTVTSLIDVDLAVVPLSRVADCLESCSEVSEQCQTAHQNLPIAPASS